LAGVMFLHPLALLGLAAAALPALLHLLERRTPPEAEFPPLRYLRDAERQSARRLRLRHLLLLILRTALVAVIVFAAPRPRARTAPRRRRSAWRWCPRSSGRRGSSPRSPCLPVKCMC